MSYDVHRCEEIREKLPLYVGEDLDGDVLDAVRGHLAVCAGCAAEMERARSARRGLVEALDAASAGLERLGSPGLWPGVRARLVAEGLVPPAPRSSAAPSAPLPVPLPPAPPRRAPGARLAVLGLPLAAAAALLVWVQVGVAPADPVLPAAELVEAPEAGAPAAFGGLAEALEPAAQEPVHGLRPVPAGEARLLDGVERGSRARPVVLPPSPNSLAGYR